MYYYLNDGNVNLLYGLDDLCKKHLNSDMVACEIGSFAGVSSRLIASYVKQLYCVDAWATYPDVSDEHLIEGEKRFDIVAAEVPNMVKLKLDSVLALSAFSDKYFDFIYIDGWHAYEQVKKEIQVAITKIKDGGIIAGHDYLNIPDVAKAVNEIFSGYEIETYSDSSWLIKL